MKGDKSPMQVQDVHPLSLQEIGRARVTVARNVPVTAPEGEAWLGLGDVLDMLGIGNPIKVTVENRAELRGDA